MSGLAGNTMVRIDGKKLKLRTGLHDTTIRRYEQTRGFPCHHFLGGRRMWWLHEVEAWEQEQIAHPRVRRSVANLKKQEPSTAA